MATPQLALSKHVGDGGRVALKVLADNLARDDRVRRRLLRESEIAAGLRHPHVVEILDFGETDGMVHVGNAKVNLAADASTYPVTGGTGVFAKVKSGALVSRNYDAKGDATDVTVKLF